ncbi:CDP-glycerol glycerophosphotransferase (TagB/SpsB family) [Staphylococcus warneri]
MITDYSSTIFDYIHLNKPIFILQEDQKDYVDDIGFYFDLFELGYFPIASLNEERLAQQIQKIKSINYSNIKNRLMNKDNKNSTENILEAVFKNTNN